MSGLKHVTAAPTPPLEASRPQPGLAPAELRDRMLAYQRYGVGLPGFEPALTRLYTDAEACGVRIVGFVLSPWGPRGAHFLMVERHGVTRTYAAPANQDWPQVLTEWSRKLPSAWLPTAPSAPLARARVRPTLLSTYVATDRRTLESLVLVVAAFERDFGARLVTTRRETRPTPHGPLPHAVLTFAESSGKSFEVAAIIYSGSAASSNSSSLLAALDGEIPRLPPR